MRSWFDRMTEELEGGRSPGTRRHWRSASQTAKTGDPGQAPSPGSAGRATPSARQARRTPVVLEGLRPEKVLPPRRTRRIRTGERSHDRRAWQRPGEFELRLMIRRRETGDIRIPALIALLVFSGVPSAMALLRWRERDLASVRMPRWAWYPVVRLLVERRRRGVDGAPLFCTWRHRAGNPLDPRVLRRSLNRHLAKRGLPPITLTAIRKTGKRMRELCGRRLSFNEHLRTCRVRPDRHRILVLRA